MGVEFFRKVNFIRIMVDNYAAPKYSKKYSTLVQYNCQSTFTS